MNAWDIDPNLYLPVFRYLSTRWRARRRRRARVNPVTAGCRG